MNTHTVTVDVRDDIRSGREPFSRIMKAVAALGAQEKLLLIAPFEPVPLFHALKKQGFSHTAQQIASGDWEILFMREGGAQPAETAPNVGRDGSHHGPAVNPASVMEVDARGLEPPQPLAKILETVANLPANAELRAHTDRRPMHLYAHLEERGFTAQTDEQSDGSFVTHIRHR